MKSREFRAMPRRNFLKAAGAAGVAAQDAGEVAFDDFSVIGAGIPDHGSAIPLTAFSSVERQGDEVILHFTAVSTYQYNLQYASSATGHWETLATVTAKLSSFEAKVPEAFTNQVRFYRLEKVPCDCRDIVPTD